MRNIQLIAKREYLEQIRGRFGGDPCHLVAWVPFRVTTAEQAGVGGAGRCLEHGIALGVAPPVK